MAKQLDPMRTVTTTETYVHESGKLTTRTFTIVESDTPDTTASETEVTSTDITSSTTTTTTKKTKAPPTPSSFSSPEFFSPSFFPSSTSMPVPDPSSPAIDIPPDTNTPSQPPSLIIIISSVAGGVVFLTLFGSLIWLLRRRHTSKRKKNKPPTNVPRKPRAPPKAKQHSTWEWDTVVNPYTNAPLYGVEYSHRGELVGHRKESALWGETDIAMNNMKRSHILSTPTPMSPVPGMRAEMSVSMEEAAELTTKRGGEGFF